MGFGAGQQAQVMVTKGVQSVLTTWAAAGLMLVWPVHEKDRQTALGVVLVDTVLRIIVHQVLPHAAAFPSREFPSCHFPTEPTVGYVSGWMRPQIVNPGGVAILPPVGTDQHEVTTNRHAECGDFALHA